MQLLKEKGRRDLEIKDRLIFIKGKGAGGGEDGEK